MEEQQLLPPAEAESKPFNLAEHAAKLKATPKERYEQPKDPEPAPPKPTPEPEKGPDPGPGGPETGGAGTKTDHEASAKEFIELYDLGQSYGFHFYSGKEPDSFKLPTFAKDRAIHHLARGLEKMGGAEAPWWMGLMIALGPHTALNFMAAKQYRQQKAKQAEAPPQTPKRGPGPVEPDSIIHHGQVIHMRPTGPKAPPKPLGACLQCGQPVKHRGRKYCSQSCAGKATTAKRKQAKQTGSEPEKHEP